MFLFGDAHSWMCFFNRDSGNASLKSRRTFPSYVGVLRERFTKGALLLQHSVLDGLHGDPQLHPSRLDDCDQSQFVKSRVRFGPAERCVAEASRWGCVATLSGRRGGLHTLHGDLGDEARPACLSCFSVFLFFQGFFPGQKTEP